MRQAEPPPKPQHAKLYPITVDGKHGFIDESGNVKFMLPEEVYTIFAFSGGLAVAGKRVPNTNWRWGFIDETGKYVTEAKFVMVKPFSEGLAAVVFKENENSYRNVGYIDQSGRMVIPPQFSSEGGVSERGFLEGLAAVKMYKDRVDKWGYIDKSLGGRRIQLCRHDGRGSVRESVGRRQTGSGNRKRTGKIQTEIRLHRSNR